MLALHGFYDFLLKPCRVWLFGILWSIEKHSIAIQYIILTIGGAVEIVCRECVRQQFDILRRIIADGNLNRHKPPSLKKNIS
jgi:hypothetical protein